MNSRQWIGVALTAVAMAATGAYALRVPISLALAKKVAQQRMATDALAELPDGLHVGLCGAGSPFPDDKRSGACTLVVAGQRLFVFDAGAGNSRNISRMGFNHGRIEAIFLTHFHSDHIDGLGELMLQRWVSTSNREPVPVHGPQGVDAVVAGFMQAYSQDQNHRVTHHGESTMHAAGFGGIAKPFTPDAQGRVVLLKDKDLEILAFTVDHGPVRPAMAYRVTYKGRTMVLSGDTRKSAAVQREATGVDLLVHEALSVPLVELLREAAVSARRDNLVKIFADIQNYHATPEEAAETARDARVGYLLLNHIAPPLPLPGMEKAFLGNASALFAGPIQVGADGDFISMPAADKRTLVSRRF